jgi:hypothetical protein
MQVGRNFITTSSHLEVYSTGEEVHLISLSTEVREELLVKSSISHTIIPSTAN